MILYSYNQESIEKPRDPGFETLKRAPFSEHCIMGFSKGLIKIQDGGSFLSCANSRGVLLGIFGGSVPPASPNPDPISDQKMPFPIPVFRLDLVRD